MKIVKRILVGLLVVIVLLIIISFFLPSKMHVERSKVMKASLETVFAQVNVLKNWEKWSPWHRIDPKMEIVYEGPQEGTGAKYSWKSTHKHVGNGSLSIIESKPHQLITASMDFMENGTGTSWYKFETTPEGTKVTWAMESELGMNPIKRYFGLMMDGMIGGDFEKGLNSLDSVSQLMPVLKIETKIVPNQFAFTVKATCKTDEEVGKTIRVMYKEIMDYMQAKKIEMSAPPLCIYHTYEPGKEIAMEAGVPIAKKMASSGKIKCVELKGGNVVMVSHYGPYEKVETAHMAIDKWIKENNKTVIGAPWEVYMNDPTTVKDPSEIHTDIYYPIQ